MNSNWVVSINLSTRPLVNEFMQKNSILDFVDSCFELVNFVINLVVCAENEFNSFLIYSYFVLALIVALFISFYLQQLKAFITIDKQLTNQNFLLLLVGYFFEVKVI